MSQLKNKIALITGASRGIGRSIALRLAKEGAMVIVHYGQNRKKAEEVVEQIQQDGGIAFAIQSDLNSVKGIDLLYQKLDQILEQHTTSVHFDILVNNAGVGSSANIDNITEASYDQVMDINVKAPIFIIQQGLSRLRDGGRIINMASSVTRIAFPDLLGYSVSKGAINTLTYVLAQQLGNRQITVNAISPGIINTDMNTETLQDPNGQQFAAGLSTFGRWGEPEDVADIAAFLASADSRWVTGQIIDASGGSHL